MKAYTDINQAKKLKEVLPTESANMTYCAITEGIREKMIIKDWQVNIGLDIAIKKNLFSYRNGYMIPCWSLTALLRLMPFHIIENNNRFGFYQVKGFNKQGETYRFGYKTNNDYFLFETSWYNDVIDAAFEMVCWLKSEEYI